jgi:hypothetical protein
LNIPNARVEEGVQKENADDGICTPIAFGVCRRAGDAGGEALICAMEAIFVLGFIFAPV